MPEKLDSDTRVARLRALGLADKFPDLVAIADSERTADAEIAALEAKNKAEFEAKRRAETPIDLTWMPTPTDIDDVCLICLDRRPHQFASVAIRGQLYIPVLPNRSIGFLESAMRPALPRTSDSGWYFTTVRDGVYLLRGFQYRQAESVIRRLASDAIPLLIAIHRVYQQVASGPARAVAEAAREQLAQYAHTVGLRPFVPAGELAERQANEADATRILDMIERANPANVARDDIEIDRETEQRQLTSSQLNAQLDKQIERAEREAAKAGVGEA